MPGDNFQASPYQWGPGKVHTTLNEEAGRIACQPNGEPINGMPTDEPVDCKRCLKILGR